VGCRNKLEPNIYWEGGGARFLKSKTQIGERKILWKQQRGDQTWKKASTGESETTRWAVKVGEKRDRGDGSSRGEGKDWIWGHS